MAEIPDLWLQIIEELDQQIFLCEGCDWWCDLSEESLDVELHCTDCEPDD